MNQILKGILKKHTILLIFEVIFITINVYLLTVPSTILGEIVDLLSNIEKNKQEILNETYCLLGMCAILLFSRVTWKMLDAKIARNIVKELRDRLFEKMLKTDVAQLENMKNGDILSHFIRDIAQIRKFVSNAITTIIRFVLNFIVVAIAMAQSTNIKLTLISLCPIVISMILILMQIKKLEENYNVSRNKFTNLSEFVQESTDSIRTTKAYVGEEKQYNEFLLRNTSLKNTNFEVIKNETMLFIYTHIGIGLGIGLSILFGSSMILSNEISIGDFVAFNGYMVILQAPIRWIPWLIKHFKKYQIAHERLDNMFQMKEEEILIDNSTNDKLEGNIKINNLTYKYPDATENVLEKINIEIKQGQSLGIIGVIGSGKTTLMNLLLKLYQVPNNSIFIDGRDINEIETNLVRDNICYITQDNFLFSTTLKENINLFRDIYDEEDILESTKSSMIYDEISEMSSGMDTVIGEKGIDLSGGQKQRVAISRAFLKNSNIVIFDDTFSALDNRTEEALLRNIRKMTENKTCIIISNRISDIKHCDEIIVLEKGKIVERGLHRDLLAKKDRYYEFYKNQAEKSKVSILA
ncbi:MAG: ABC transporter ATP-binding protein [Clostridia bacterium]|nr:ABC transporter ATP-binding protein [Clostridia bacterium]